MFAKEYFPNHPKKEQQYSSQKACSLKFLKKVKEKLFEKAEHAFLKEIDIL